MKLDEQASKYREEHQEASNNSSSLLSGSCLITIEQVQSIDNYPDHRVGIRVRIREVEKPTTRSLYLSVRSRIKNPEISSWQGFYSHTTRNSRFPPAKAAKVPVRGSREALARMNAECRELHYRQQERRR